jgi:Dolichyl-phosphate-mannose-protein mannosyltransferase
MILMLSRLRLFHGLSALFVVIGVGRIVFSYQYTAQAFDEPTHIAAGIEFLDEKRYTLDPVHPPLSRIAIALPLYLVGERFPKLRISESGNRNYENIGNHVIYDSGHFRRNLALARIGLLPFFILGALIVYLWTVSISGERSALLAVFLYTTTPTVLALSSIAYTDIVAASTQVAALFAFSNWLESPIRKNTLWLGLGLGAAFLAKLTSFLFLPAAGFCIFLVWVLNRANRDDANFRKLVFSGAGALALAVVTLWAGYRFSIEPLQQATGLNPAVMPSFQHFPAATRSILRTLVTDNPRLPAPAFLNAVSEAWVLNKSASHSYLFGKIRSGSTWYFFLCGLAFKLPIPLLILFFIGVVLLIKNGGNRTRYFPPAALAGILLITTRVHYQVGIRHILVCLPLIAIVAAAGLSSWLEAKSWRSLTLLSVFMLAAWQTGETIAAQSDFLSYFNEFAGRDPSKILTTGCDFDCGEDLYRLARELRVRNISRLTLAVWSSAEVKECGIPDYDMPDPNTRANGWLAVSDRALRIGDFLHQSLPPESFAYLQHYSPVVDIGKTIKLYYIDANLKP